MIDKHIKERIEARALEIYEWRQANGIPGCATSDWLDAELEFLEKRQIDYCPVCSFKIIAKKDDDMICMRSGCDWKVLSKRKTDEKVPSVQEIKKDWA